MVMLQCFSKENEINGTILVKAIDMLLVMCDKVSKEAAASYLVQIESSYHHFDKSAQEFVQVLSYLLFH